MGLLLSVLPIHQAARCMFYNPIKKRSIFPDATWHSGEIVFRKSADSTSNFVLRATMSMYAGEFRSRGGNWALAPPQWSGTTVEIHYELIGGSKRAMAKRRRYWKINGQVSITPPGI